MFLQTKIPFLGHIVSSEGLSTDPENIEGVKDGPHPANGNEVRSFLGLAGYYRALIPSYHRLAFPLTRLTENLRPFWWTAECERVFTHLNETLTAAPILSFPELSRKGLVYPRYRS
uniref:Retrovirus-related Pol polyprotein from transposon 17.6 n=1 Tax=Schistocephalus solidus TaxID=70667 RepID=A0A0V0JAM9_SCHSO